MANSTEIIEYINKLLDERTKKALDGVVEYATKQAQVGFERFAIETPADDPIVFVINTPTTKYSKTGYTRQIECVGNQVLFMEFGGGLYYYTDVETRLYQNIIPIEPRPVGIVDIGTYGRGFGSDDYWFYTSKNGRESETSQYVKATNTGYTMITHGNRPARALYRAVGMAIRRLKGGKLK